MRKVLEIYRITNNNGNQLTGNTNNKYSSNLLFRINKLRRINKY